MTVAVVLGRRVSPEISGLNLLLNIETEFSSCGSFVSGDRQTFTLLLILTYWRDDRRLSSYLTSICFMHTLLNHIMIGLTSYLPPHYLPTVYVKGFPCPWNMQRTGTANWSAATGKLLLYMHSNQWANYEQLCRQTADHRRNRESTKAGTHYEHLVATWYDWWGYLKMWFVVFRQNYIHIILIKFV